jgi:hypothetical protein
MKEGGSLKEGYDKMGWIREGVWWRYNNWDIE